MTPSTSTIRRGACPSEADVMSGVCGLWGSDPTRSGRGAQGCQVARAEGLRLGPVDPLRRGATVVAMRVGVPTEAMPDEYRVAITPSGVRELREAGHEVFVQRGAGEGSAIADEDYRAQGATVVADADAVFEEAQLIVKVKEPQPLGGRGVLLGGVPGVAAANVLIIGGGVVGMNAAFIALGMEADVFVFDRDIDRLRELDIVFGGRCSTCFSSTLEIETRLAGADLVIGAVLVHGARAPRVISRAQLGLMKPGAVLVDVSIDQGGCFETSRPTTHSEPTYEVDGIRHYCVTNMPGAVPITSTYALTNATLPYVLALSDLGVHAAVAADPGLKKGVNLAAGQVTYPPVAEAVDLPHADPDDALA